MPRELRPILLCLIAGAIATLLIAWISCITLPNRTGFGAARASVRTIDRDASTWPHKSPDGLGLPSYFFSNNSWRFDSDFAVWSRPTPDSPATLGSEHMVDVVCAGQPFRAFSCRFDTRSRLSQPIRSDLSGALRFTTSFAAGTLPCRPVWPGFLLDTLLFACLLWLCWRAPALIRRRRRTRANRCTRCAYDRRGLPAAAPCPECGNMAPG